MELIAIIMVVGYAYAIYCMLMYIHNNNRRKR